MPTQLFAHKVKFLTYITNSPILDINTVIPAVVGSILALLVVLVLVSGEKCTPDCQGLILTKFKMQTFRSHMSLADVERASRIKKSNQCFNLFSKLPLTVCFTLLHSKKETE